MEIMPIIALSILGLIGVAAAIFFLKAKAGAPSPSSDMIALLQQQKVQLEVSLREAIGASRAFELLAREFETERNSVTAQIAAEKSASAKLAQDREILQGRLSKLESEVGVAGEKNTTLEARLNEEKEGSVRLAQQNRAFQEKVSQIDLDLGVERGRVATLETLLKEEKMRADKNLADSKDFQKKNSDLEPELRVAKERIQSLNELARENDSSRQKLIEENRIFQETISDLVPKLSVANEKSAIVEGQLRDEKTRVATLTQLADGLQARVSKLEPDLRSAQSQNEFLINELEKQKQLLVDLTATMENKFRLMAQAIVQEQSKKIQDFGKNDMGALLIPLMQDIRDFKAKIDATHVQETKDRGVLQSRVQDLINAQGKLSTEADRLVNALRADTKKQGNWGEIVLRRILESSGLREGHDFIEQGKGLGLETEEGQAQKPDVTINLPDGKHLIIDSKVTLNSFDNYMNESGEARELALAAFETAVQNHVDGLSGKHYHSNAKLESPDYVFMFMPTEATFAILMEKKRNIVEDAWTKRIIIVGPTNLMACLKTVETVWKVNRQNQNIEQVMRLGTRMLNQFSEFLKEFQSVGEKLDSARNSWNDAKTRLRGKQGLIPGMKRMESLGVTKSAKKNWNKIAEGVEEYEEIDATDEAPIEADVAASSNTDNSSGESAA